MSAVAQLVDALRGDIQAAARKAASKEFDDVHVSVDAAGKRLSDAQQALTPADLARFTRVVWTLFCGPATDEVAAEATAGATTLLGCLASLQDAVCTSSGSASAKATSEALQLLRVALTPPLRSGASARQLLRLKCQVWGLLTALDLLNKLKDAQTECLGVIADLVQGTAPATSDAVDADCTDEAAGTVDPWQRAPVATLSAAQLGAHDVLRKCVDVANKSSAGGQGVRAVALRLMGTLMMTFPDALGDERNAVRCGFDRAAHHLAEQQKVEQVVGEGLLDGLSAFLTRFPLDSGNATDYAFIVFIHQIVKNALSLVEISTNYRLCNAALRFLTARAADTLAVCILGDSVSYLSLLHTLWRHKNRNVHRGAYAATPSYLQALAGQLIASGAGGAPLPGGTPQPPEIAIEGALTLVGQILSTAGTDSSELSFAFIVCGYMARPLRVCAAAEAAEALFSQLIEKTSWLFPSIAPPEASSLTSAVSDEDVDGTDGHAGHLTHLEQSTAVPSSVAPTHGDWAGRDDVARLTPHLLVAFSCFIAEVPRMSADVQRALFALLDATLRMLPSDIYFERLRDTTVFSLLKLLLTAEHKAPPGIDVCAHVCERLLWLACVADGGGGDLKVDTAETSSHQLGSVWSVDMMPTWWRRIPVMERQGRYTQFFCSVVKACNAYRPAQWGAPWSELSLLAVAQRLQEAMTRSIRGYLSTLDVTVLFHGRPASINVVLAHSGDENVLDGADGLVPQSPADYAFLLNAVCFHSGVAGCLWVSLACPAGSVAERLGDWVVQLARGITNAPHVSGYYTLLYTALQVAASSVPSVDDGDGSQPLLTPHAYGVLERLQRQCAQRLSTYTEELLCQCAAAYIAILTVCDGRTEHHMEEKAADGAHLTARTVPNPECGTLLRAFTVVFASAPSEPSERPSHSGARTGYRAALTSSDEISTRAVEATVRFALRALEQFVERRPFAAARLLPALLAAPELGERADVRATLAELTARHGDRISGVLSHSTPTAYRETALTGTGTTPPPRWRSQKVLVQLPFPSSVAVNFPITVVLGRVAHLSCHASQPHVRSPAAELLHFSVVWLLGCVKAEAERGSSGGEDSATSWLSALLPTMLQLASGHTQDGVARTLFRDLLLQTARWISLASLRWKSPNVALARHSLEKTLCDHLCSQHAPLRRVAAETLDEYLRWCGRQISGGDTEASTAAVVAQCAAVLGRIRLDLRASYAWARLGAVTLLHRLVWGMRGSRGNTTGTDNEVSTSDAPALCKLLLRDWMLWLAALVACLRISLCPSVPASASDGRQGAAVYLDELDGADDAGGDVAESLATIDALHALLADDGPAGAAARSAVKSRQGAEVTRELSSAAAPLADPLNGLLRDMLELCWLSCTRPEAGGTQSLWRVMVQLSRVGFDATAGDEEATLQGQGTDGSGQRALVQWLRGPRGQLALCALIERGASGAAAVRSSLALCTFVSQRLRDGCGEDSVQRLGAKRARSDNESEASSVSLVTTDVVRNAVQLVCSAVEEDDSRLWSVAVLDTLTQFVEVCVVDGVWEGRGDASGRAPCRSDVWLLDRGAAAEVCLVPPMFDLATRTLFSASRHDDATRAVGARATGALYVLASSSSLATPAGGRALTQLLGALRACVPTALQEASDCEGVMQCLARPRSAREVLNALLSVVSLTQLARPGGGGTISILVEVLSGLPQAQQDSLQRTWLAVLQLVSLDDHSTALPRDERQLLIEALFVICVSLRSSATHVDLAASLAHIVRELDAASQASEAEPLMLLVAQACGDALQRLVYSQTDGVAHSPAGALDASLRVLCETVRDRLFSSPDARTEGEWQTAREFSALLLLRVLDVEARLSRHSTMRKRGESRSDHRLDVLQRVLRPPPTVAECGDEEHASGDDDGGWSRAIGHDAARMTYLLRLLSTVSANHIWAASFTSNDNVAKIVAAVTLAAGSTARWTGAPHTLLASAPTVRLLELAVCVLCRCVLCRCALSSASPPACYLESARGVLLNTLKAELPLDWKELEASSVEASALPRVIRSLVALAAAMAPHEPGILTRLLPLLAQTDLPDMDVVSGAVTEAIQRLPMAGRLSLCESCADLQSGGLPPSMWWAATYRLTLPVLHSFPDEQRVEFFASHVVEWVNDAGRAPQCSPHRQTNALVLLESMYRLMDAAALRGPINAAYVNGRSGAAAATPTGKELVLALIKLCNSVRTSEAPAAGTAADDSADDWFAYRQAAVRCMVAVATATQQQEAVFVKILLDASNVEGWCRVVDTRTSTVLPVECAFPLVPEQLAVASSDWELRNRSTVEKPGVAHQVESLLDNRLADEALEAAAVGGPGGTIGDSVWFASSVSFGGRLSTGTMLRQNSTAAALTASTLAGVGPARAAPPASTPGREIVLDGVWRSTCLGAFLCAVDAMIDRFQAVAAAPVGAWAPSWVMELYKVLTSPSQPVPVKLVIVRLVLLRATFFAAYAHHFIEPMIDVIADASLGRQLHYIAREVVCAVVDWIRQAGEDGTDGDGQGCVPSTAAATKLVRYLFPAILACTDGGGSEQYIVRNNIDLFKGVCTAMGTARLCEALRGVPVVDLVATAAVASNGCEEVLIQLLGALVNSGVCLAKAWDKTSVSAVYQHLVQRVSRGGRQTLPVAAAEVLAVELQALAQQETTHTPSSARANDVPDSALGQLESLLRDALESHWASAPPTVLRVLRVVEAYHPAILTARLASLVLTRFPTRTEEEQLVVLDVLGTAPVVTASLFDGVSAQFAGVLENFCGTVRAAVYTLLNLLVPHLGLDAVCQLARLFLSPAALKVVKHGTEERTCFFQLAVTTCSRLRSPQAAARASGTDERTEGGATAREASEGLLRLLISAGLAEGSSPFVQDVILAHLDEVHYPDSPPARLAAVLSSLSRLEGVGDNTHWLRHAAVLLLAPCRRTRAYDETNYFFSAPLAECDFAPKDLTAAATQGTQTRQPAPLFTDSLGTAGARSVGVRGVTALPFTYVGASQRPSPAATAGTTKPRAGVAAGASARQSDQRAEHYRGTTRRQPTVFPSSVQLHGLATAVLTAHTGGHAGAGLVQSKLLSQRVADGEQGDAARGTGRRAGREPLARRLRPLPSENRIVLHMVGASRSRQEREQEEREQQRRQRGHRILFRQYRDGELPDVQVPVGACLAPLQALCLHDAVTAQLTCVALVKAIMASPDSPRQGDEGGKTPAVAGPGSGGDVPFFARPAGAFAATSASAEAAVAQQKADAMHALCQLIAAAVPTLGAATPTLTLGTVQELLLFTEGQWRARQDEAYALNRQMAQAVTGRQLGQSTATAEVSAGAAASFAECLVTATTTTGPVIEPAVWSDLARLLGVLGESDLLCEALLRAAGVRSRLAVADRCLATLRDALHAEESGAYEQALDLMKACAAQLPSSIFAKATTTVQTELRELLHHHRTQSARAILHWQTVHDLCLPENGSEAADAISTTARKGVAAMRLEASRHVAVSEVPVALERLRKLIGSEFTGVTGPYAFECVSATLLAARWAEAEEQALRGVTHMLRGFSVAGDGHVLLDGEAARACQEAYRLHQAEQVASVLSLLTEDRPGSRRAVRHLATHGFPALVSPTPHLVDSALWLHQRTAEALEEPIRERFGEAAWGEVQAALASGRVALCRSGCESLLRSPLTNGAVKALLDAVVPTSTEAHAPLLYATALRANLFRLAHTGPQQTSVPVSDLVEGLQRRVRDRSNQLPPDELRALQVDVDWCAMQLFLRHGGAAPPRGRSDAVLTSLLHHATSMSARLSDSVEAHMRLLMALDQTLRTLPPPEDAEGDEATPGESPSPDDAPGTVSTRWACWHLYLQTFAWCGEVVGPVAAVVASGAQADVVTQVPRTLQVFDFLARHARSMTPCELTSMIRVMERLQRLPTAMWRPWPSQLISTLLRTQQLAPAQWLRRLAQADPQVVYYPYNCARDELQSLEVSTATDPSVRAVLRELRDVLDSGPRLRRVRLLAHALMALREPGMRLRDALRQLAQMFRRFAGAPLDSAQRDQAYQAANAHFQRTWATFADSSDMADSETVRLAFRGLATRVLTPFTADAATSTSTAAAGTALCTDWEQFKVAYGAADGLLRGARDSPPSVARMESYSAKLYALLCHAADRTSHCGDEEALEVPTQTVLALEHGRLRGATSSLGAHRSADEAVWRAEYVVGANPSVRVLSSVQKPKRLELYSSLMNTHVFLAKGGDDLRLDQRVEELFCVLNRYLQRWARSDACLLYVYSVIPLSVEVGLVQWVSHTETMREAMDRASGGRLMSDPSIAVYAQRYAAGVPAYLACFRDEPAAQVSQWYENLVQATPQGLLQHALQLISPSLSHWYGVRDGFVKSNAALSISAHTFGIGDRHLANFLIATGSGRLIGIDYGHAFGSATEDLPIPELVPFRLTPQIKQACGVMGEQALGCVMRRVLHSLREHRSVMESLAQAFVHEPLTQWKQGKPEQRGITAHRKLRGVACKLNLDAPWNTLLENLKYNTSIAQFEKAHPDPRRHDHGNRRWLLASIRDAVLYTPPQTARPVATDEEAGGGECADSAQSELREEAAYVQQLLDLAQNSAVLSRAYVGWNPLF